MEKSEQFVDRYIKMVRSDTACRAALLRADNPVTAPAAWRYLVPFCPLTDKRQRLAYSLVGAAIAREKPESNGNLSIGEALRFLKSREDEDRELARLKRLLACSDSIELVGILQKTVRYLQSKDMKINYAKLLDDIIYWNEKTRIRWAEDFFVDQKEDTPKNLNDLPN